MTRQMRSDWTTSTKLDDLCVHYMLVVNWMSRNIELQQTMRAGYVYGFTLSVITVIVVQDTRAGRL